MRCIGQPASVWNLAKCSVAIVVIENVDAAKDRVRQVFYKQIEFSVIVVIDPKRAFSVIASKFEPDQVADVGKGTVAIAFIENISRGIISLGAPLIWRFDNNEIQLAVPIVVSKSKA